MKADLKIDGVMILTGAAIIAALGVAYFVKKKGAAVVDAVNPMSDKNLAYTGANKLGAWITGDANWNLGGEVYDFTHGVAPAMSITKNDGSKVTVTQSDLKKYNANPTNMGMIAWPTSGTANVSPWYAGAGYQMEDWEKDNPFGAEPDASGDTFLYTADSPLGKIVDYVSSWFDDEKKPADYTGILIPDKWADGTTGW